MPKTEASWASGVGVCVSVCVCLRIKWRERSAVCLSEPPGLWEDGLGPPCPIPGAPVFRARPVPVGVEAGVQPGPRPVPEDWVSQGAGSRPGEGSAVRGSVANPVLPQPAGSLASWEGGRL